MFLLRSDGMPEADRRLLSAVARVVLRGDLGELAPQLDRPTPWLYPGRTVPPSAELRHPEPAAAPVPVPPLVMENGMGGFTPDGREYVIVLDGDRETPLPWSNVLANAEFGTMVSASGSAFTWAENSRENRLTPFANDPVCRSDRRSDLSARRRLRRGLGRHAGPAASPGRRRPLGGSPRRRRDAVPARDRRPRAGADGLRRAGRSGEAGGA